ncbi:hypothetical protein M5K25_011999 [Dendrobium thyrsiflorum]|uniref:Uncharacterized protein n=1 Tax=Dendrobium thyrsiflorum TaxID=117978 RepID=A0ABD0V4L9_DENTH
MSGLGKEQHPNVFSFSESTTVSYKHAFVSEKFESIGKEGLRRPLRFCFCLSLALWFWNQGAEEALEKLKLLSSREVTGLTVDAAGTTGRRRLNPRVKEDEEEEEEEDRWNEEILSIPKKGKKKETERSGESEKEYVCLEESFGKKKTVWCQRTRFSVFTMRVKKDSRFSAFFRRKKKESRFSASPGWWKDFVRASPPCCGSKRRVTIVLVQYLEGRLWGVDVAYIFIVGSSYTYRREDKTKESNTALQLTSSILSNSKVLKETLATTNFLLLSSFSLKAIVSEDEFLLSVSLEYSQEFLFQLHTFVHKIHPVLQETYQAILLDNHACCCSLDSLKQTAESLSVHSESLNQFFEKSPSPTESRNAQLFKVFKVTSDIIQGEDHYKQANTNKKHLKPEVHSTCIAANTVSLYIVSNSGVWQKLGSDPVECQSLDDPNFNFGSFQLDFASRFVPDRDNFLMTYQLFSKQNMKTFSVRCMHVADSVAWRCAMSRSLLIIDPVALLSSAAEDPSHLQRIYQCCLQGSLEAVIFALISANYRNVTVFDAQSPYFIHEHMIILIATITPLQSLHAMLHILRLGETSGAGSSRYIREKRVRYVSGDTTVMIFDPTMPEKGMHASSRVPI